MNTDQKLDIHVATDSISPRLLQHLQAMQYRTDDFIGGSMGVAHVHHFSYHPISKEDFNRQWAATVDILTTAEEGEFIGFMEGETTTATHEVLLPYKPFDRAIPFPIGKLMHKECPPDQHKNFDIHVAVDMSTLDKEMQDLLEHRIGFYYADIRKPTGKIVRVYTFQPVGVPRATDLFNRLADYFTRAGGFTGKLKMEVAINYARFPSTVCVPPIVTKLELLPDYNSVTPE